MLKNRLAALTIALAIVAAACGDSGDGTATTATIEPTTTQAATTEAPTTTATTTTSAAPTTTTSTTPTAPVDTLSVATTASCVLGWWDGTWHSVADDDSVDPPVAAGATLQVATLDGISRAEVVELYPYFDVGYPAWSVDTEPALSSGVAIAGPWDPIPHLVEISGASQQVYLDQAAQLMTQRGYPNVPVELAQVIRTDLEGDLVNEVIVAARHPGAPSFTPEVGVFSIIFLRRVVDGEVQTAILHDSVYSAGDVGQATSVEHALVEAVADLNGDGVMEIIIDGGGYEWYWSEAFEYVDDDLGPVSRMVCGGGV